MSTAVDTPQAAPNSGSVERGKKSLAGLFAAPKDVCRRCGSTVYAVERVGPFHGSMFHKSCFRCTTCGQSLTAATFCTNTKDVTDKEVYCKKHAPSQAVASFGADAIGISGALNAQKKVSESKMGAIQRELRGTDPGKAGAFGKDAIWIRHAMNAPKLDTEGRMYDGEFTVDENAMFIRSPLAMQLLRQGYSKEDLAKHHFPALISKRRQQIYDAQENLEAMQREEESQLLSQLLAERERENELVQQELDKEWESKLRDLTDKFDREQKKKGKRMKDSEIKAMTMKMEQDKRDIEDSIEEKRKQAQQAVTMRLRQQEQDKTAELVRKHGDQMKELIENVQREIAEELTEEIRETMADEELDEPLPTGEQILQELGVSVMRAPKDLPPPHPPSCRKKDLYPDPSVFDELDNHVISIAENEQETFTDLVRKLTEHCITDLEKVRAIFRWITVKDLNVIEFSDKSGDTPMGLLRGIKFGTETYHVLFMRLCSYAGLHCVEIKGHSKSVGYEPGMRFHENHFHNTWNAVLVDGDWRLIQCNWGARHLVLNKDKSKQIQREPSDKKRDKIRYQYDEHYFLTDPDEFIQEFWPFETDWELLEESITLQQFEELPFVRSVFFHYGMNFESKPRAVIFTGENGGAEIRISVDEKFSRDVVFHYQLRFASRELSHKTEVGGAKLERYVFQGMFGNQVLYNVYVPLPGEYFLEIFANKIDDSHKLNTQSSAIQPFRLKCACKFKIICEKLSNKMHPLPDCATGEWGPSKAVRHFGLEPVTHKHGVINVSTGEAQVQFRLTQPLQFLLKLRTNNFDDKELEKYLSHSLHREILDVRMRFPKAGQYGLDVYARPQTGLEDSQTLAHACKYLINVGQINRSSVSEAAPQGAQSRQSGDFRRDASLKIANGHSNERPLPDKPLPDKPLPMPPGLSTKLGALPEFRRLGLKNLSHKDAKIHLKDKNFCTVEVGLAEPLFVSYQLWSDPGMEDRKNLVELGEGERKVIFNVELREPGQYILAIYARTPQESIDKMRNVYNYSIRYGNYKTRGKSILSK